MRHTAFAPDMGLISRRLFERHLSAHMNQIQPGLAALLRRKVGYAWRPIVDEMYRQRADDLTFCKSRSGANGLRTFARAAE
jgi:hypothetical protein